MRSKYQASINPKWLPESFNIRPRLGPRLQIFWNYVTMGKLSASCPSSKLWLQPLQKGPIRSKSYVRQFVYPCILLLFPVCLIWCVKSDSLHIYRWLQACLSNLKMDKHPTLSKKWFLHPRSATWPIYNFHWCPQAIVCISSFIPSPISRGAYHEVRSCYATSVEPGTW